MVCGWGCAFREQSFVTDRTWPTLTAERPATNGSHAVHSRRCHPGRPLYVVQLPVISSFWPALDDPLRTFESPISLPASSR